MSKPTTPLSALAVSNALRDGRPVVLKDTRSLTLKVTGPNRGSWIFRGRLAGTKHIVEVLCGHAPEMSLKAARDQRDKAAVQLREGINPNAERKARLAARAKQVEAEEAPTAVAPPANDVKTFGDVADEYFALRTDLVPRNLQCEQGRVRNHMQAIMDVPVAEIDRLTHLKPLVEKLVGLGQNEQARRVGGLVGRIMNYALDAGYIKFSPADHLVRLVPRLGRGPRPHFAATTSEEGAADLFRRLWAYTDSGRSISYLNSALRLSCYLPVRNGNMIAAKWEDIDMERGTWHFPETKNGHAYTVPLTRQMRAILEELRRHSYNSWCFPSGSRLGHITNNGMARLLRRAGVPREEHCLHGFRSTFESISLNHGLPKVLCERLLFHVAGDRVEQAYNRATYDAALLPALQWWNDTVDSLRLGTAVPALPNELTGRYM